MIKVEYPTHPFRIKGDVGKECIFDEFRKQWITLTPEEWVRQNFLQYLVQVKKYPLSLIAVEKEIQLGELKKRFDILVYNANHRPWMMVECKSTAVRIDEHVLAQILRYNISVPVPFLVITNGSYVYGYERKEGRIEILRELPGVE
jgi:hypothetical protein